MMYCNTSRGNIESGDPFLQKKNTFTFLQKKKNTFTSPPSQHHCGNAPALTAGQRTYGDPRMRLANGPASVTNFYSNFE
jgi:hypothetical protein